MMHRFSLIDIVINIVYMYRYENIAIPFLGYIVHSPEEVYFFEAGFE